MLEAITNSEAIGLSAALLQAVFALKIPIRPRFSWCDVIASDTRFDLPIRMICGPVPLIEEALNVGTATHARHGRGWLTHLVVVALILVAPSHALADLRLCNFTESRVGITVGYKDDKGWLTEGWWNVLARGCATLITGELKGRFYYVHGIDYDRGGEWAGKTVMCVDDKSFAIRDVRNCVSRGHKDMGFYEVDTGDAKDYTIRLIDPVKNSTGSQ